MSNAYKFRLCSFADLSNDELYAILRIRQEVFIVEQTCYYLDADGKDFDSLHLFQMLEGSVIAYARLLPPSLSYPREASIGRVLTAPSHRGLGLGRSLMREAMEHCGKLWPEAGICISAQCYLENFYKSLGFASTEKRYLEDGIPHVEMHCANDSKK